MPRRPLKPCNKPGCGALTHGRFCPKHEQEDRKRVDQARGTAAQRGYGYRWQKASKAYLAAHPLCAECARNGRTTAARVVDHIVPHKNDMRLFWDRNNWQPLCKPCHDTKTATEDGGWGRGVQISGPGPH